MNTAEQFIKEKLQGRITGGSIRRLSTHHPQIDFCSNDYLGFAKSETLKEAISATVNQNHFYLNGSGGSRLLSGNFEYTEDTESFIADFHQAEASLIFNSGYDANIGLLSSLAQRGDTIITDELIHASLIDGARLTHAHRYSFRHNDLTDLETKLKNAKSGHIYVVTESIYSMDGDIAPLSQISELCEQYKANLIVDEAHAVGLFGNHGRGIVQQLNLQHKIFARIVTFGKALGCHGAAVLGSNELRQYLINFARSFIYTTAAPLHSIVAIKCAYEQLLARDHTVLIQHKIKTYADLLKKNLPGNNISATGSAIQLVHLKGNEHARNAAGSLQSKGLDVRAILSPTVPAGQERLRICLHTFNTDQEIQMLIRELSNLITSNE